MATPLIVHSALAARDLDAAMEWRATINSTMYRGEALTRDLQALAGGIAALEGRRTEALAQFREAMAGYRALDLAFDEALTALDMVELLGADEAELRAAADSARATLTRLGATPLLERLDAGLAKPATTGQSSASATTGARERSATRATG